MRQVHLETKMFAMHLNVICFMGFVFNHDQGSWNLRW